MKKIVMSIILLFSTTFSFSQKIEIELSQFQLFSHDKNIETNKAIKKNTIFYYEAYYTDTKLIFDLDNKILVQNHDGISDTLVIREVRRNSEVMEVDVIYPKPILVNYFLSKTAKAKEDILVCRWVEGDKIVGWADKSIKIKKGVE